MMRIFLVVVVMAMVATSAMAGMANDRAEDLGMVKYVNDLTSGSRVLMAYLGTQGTNVDKMLDGGIEFGMKNSFGINEQAIRMALSEYAGISADPKTFIRERAKRMATALIFIQMDLTKTRMPDCIKQQVYGGVVPDSDNYEGKLKAIFYAGALTPEFLGKRISVIKNGAAVDKNGNTIRQFADFDDESIWSTLGSVCESVYEGDFAYAKRIKIK